MKEWDDEIHEKMISGLSILNEHRKVDLIPYKRYVLEGVKQFV